MPNWCQNEVRIYAEGRGRAEAFVNFVRDGNNYFSFDKIIPMPSDLKGHSSPSRIVSQIKVDEYQEYEYKTIANKDVAFYSAPITQEMSDKFKEEHGCDNWYDWANKNWGTKWDAFCEDMQINDFGKIEYKFETAWNPPKPIHAHLTELFPNIEIDWFYREDGMQISGWL